MFNQDFYPTPKHVVDVMLSHVDLIDKVVLEPSAGSGNLVEYLKEKGARVLACELHPDLAKIVSQKADQFIGNDFLSLKSSDISHVEFIVMNPPFSKDEQHILHAWDIAPAGCHIISLCNFETINNAWSTTRRQLNVVVKNYGRVDNLGNVFTDAERKTKVNIGLVNLYKPKSEDQEFDGYFDMEEEIEEAGTIGLMKHNDVREVVNRYVSAVKMFDGVIRASDEINQMMAPISAYSGISFGGFKRVGSGTAAISRDDFKKDLQKAAWLSVFKRFKMEKYLTTQLYDELNKFVEKQSNTPFTMGNVYKMIKFGIYLIKSHARPRAFN